MSEQSLDEVKRPILAPAQLAAMRATIETRLQSLFRQHHQETRLDCAIRHGLLSPGKRFRPMITLLACEQAGGNRQNAVDAACAVEMVHAASLIMDDLPAMDNAKLRRGSLATHVVFGEGTGLLASISLMNEAYRVVGQSHNVGHDRRLRAIDHLCTAIGPDGLSGGQERDIMCGRIESRTSDVSILEMEERHTNKTGALFAAAGAIGGECANASPEGIALLQEYGNCLGLAYQAFDDVVDSCCSREDAGKDVDQDTEKTTVVSLLGQDGARKSARRWLDRAIEVAEKQSMINCAPLACLARQVGEKFGALTG